MDINLKDKIKQLKEMVKIRDIVSFYSNANFNSKNKCCCPLPGHTEDTPSFTLNLKHNYFKCFGCGLGGDSIKFVQIMFNISCEEAVNKIIKDFNFPIETKNISYEEKQKLTQEENKLKYENKVLKQEIEKINRIIISKLRKLRFESYKLYEEYKKNIKFNCNNVIICEMKLSIEKLKNEINKYEEIYLILNGIKSNDIKLSKKELLEKIESGKIKL